MSALENKIEAKNMKMMLLSQQKVINYLVENAQSKGNLPSEAVAKEMAKVEKYNSMLMNPKSNGPPGVKQKVKVQGRKGSQPK